MKSTSITIAVITMVLASGLCAEAQAGGRVVYQVQVKGGSSIWVSLDSTVDNPRGTLVGYRSALVINGREVTALAKPAHFLLAMGQVKRFPLKHVVPSRATLRGRGHVVVEFYLHRRRVYTAVLPFANGRYLKTGDGCTVRVP